MRKLLPVLCLLAGCALVGCTDPDRARDVLSAQGFTRIEITGYDFFGCSSESDTFATGFTAVSPTGRKVTGVVCSGWFKGATVRFH